MDETFSETDLEFSISHDGKYSNIQVGLPGEMDDGVEKDANSSLACINSMAKDRQITMALKVDPTLWERPEFNFANPLLQVWQTRLREFVSLVFD